MLSLLILEIPLVILIEPYRYIFFIFHVKIDQHLFMALAIDANGGIDIFRAIEAYSCILEMREDVFFFYFDFASALLLVVQEIEGTIRTNDRVIVVLVNGL